MAMRVERGACHGTSLQCAIQIERSKFQFRPGNGRIGKAAYFWKEDGHARYLAICWYRFYLHKGYVKDAAPRCAVIKADLEADETEWLDLTNKALLLRVNQLAVERGVDADNIAQISNVFDAFIRIVQEEMGVEFKVLRGEVPPPGKTTPQEKNAQKYPIKILGLPICFAVKDNGVIKNASVEAVKEAEVQSA